MVFEFILLPDQTSVSLWYPGIMFWHILWFRVEPKIGQISWPRSTICCISDTNSRQYSAWVSTGLIWLVYINNSFCKNVLDRLVSYLFTTVLSLNEVNPLCSQGYVLGFMVSSTYVLITVQSESSGTVSLRTQHNKICELISFNMHSLFISLHPRKLFVLSVSTVNHP